MKYLQLVIIILTFDLTFSQETVTYYGGDNPYRYSIKEKGNLINGKKDGIWTKYYQTGIGEKNPFIEEKGSYVSGEKEGIWYTYYGYEAHNAKKEKINYSHGIMFGEYTMYKLNGEIIEHGYYNSQGKKDGEWLYYRTESYLNNLIEKKIYKNGEVLSFYKYIDGKQIEVAIIIENKTIKYNQFNSNGKPDGLWTTFYDNPRKDLKDKGTYIDGKKDGEWIYYDPANGGQATVLLVENYTNGVLDGLRTSYFSDGSICEINNYKNGCKNGEQISYYSFPSTIKSKLNYTQCKNGYREDYGEQILYYPNGEIEQRYFYKNGRLDGEWIQYRKDGQITYKTIYKDGVIIWKGSF